MEKRMIYMLSPIQTLSLKLDLLRSKIPYFLLVVRLSKAELQQFLPLQFQKSKWVFILKSYTSKRLFQPELGRKPQSDQPIIYENQL
jgi:hypothetical protein